MIPIAALAMAACAGPQKPLIVKQYTLRDQERATDWDPMMRMEKSRRLHGAVSMTERVQRIGQYFTVIWHDADGVGKGPVEVIFEYQQGGTASLVKKMRKEFPASEASGKAEFAVIGNDYFYSGRVLAWRSSVRRGGEEVASRQSYLWR
jgi:hypothetical protein